jgi:hypothetical protein
LLKTSENGLKVRFSIESAELLSLGQIFTPEDLNALRDVEMRERDLALLGDADFPVSIVLGQVHCYESPFGLKRIRTLSVELLEQSGLVLHRGDIPRALAGSIKPTPLTFLCPEIKTNATLLHFM